MILVKILLWDRIESNAEKSNTLSNQAERKCMHQHYYSLFHYYENYDFMREVEINFHFSNINAYCIISSKYFGSKQ